jgi:hypothetical protein
MNGPAGEAGLPGLVQIFPPLKMEELIEAINKQLKP